MIVLRSPKGWTCPKEVDGHKVEGFWRAHQVPVLDVQTNPEHLRSSKTGCAAISPKNCSTRHGALIPELKATCAQGQAPDERNPHANGGALRKPLDLPDFRDYAVRSRARDRRKRLPTACWRNFLRDVMRRNMTNFRVFGPDETASNRLQAIYEASKKTWLADYLPEDADGTEIAPDGRVMEMLSEHTLEGWLEGYVLTGRHGFFSTLRVVRARHRFDV